MLINKINNHNINIITSIYNFLLFALTKILSTQHLTIIIAINKCKQIKNNKNKMELLMVFQVINKLNMKRYYWRAGKKQK